MTQTNYTIHQYSDLDGNMSSDMFQEPSRSVNINGTTNPTLLTGITSIIQRTQDEYGNRLNTPVLFFLYNPQAENEVLLYGIEGKETHVVDQLGITISVYGVGSGYFEARIDIDALVEEKPGLGGIFRKIAAFVPYIKHNPENYSCPTLWKKAEEKVNNDLRQQRITYPTAGYRALGGVLEVSGQGKNADDLADSFVSKSEALGAQLDKETLVQILSNALRPQREE